MLNAVSTSSLLILYNTIIRSYFHLYHSKRVCMCVCVFVAGGGGGGGGGVDEEKNGKALLILLRQFFANMYCLGVALMKPSRRQNGFLSKLTCID